MDITTLDERGETTAEVDRMMLIDEIMATFALLSPEAKVRYLDILRSLTDEAAA